MKKLKYILIISLSLLILIGAEGMFSLGAAFIFEEYTLIGWISQFLAVAVTVCVAILIAHEANE
jgi:ABC-type uncharacterized transport system permease subunit